MIQSSIFIRKSRFCVQDFKAKAVTGNMVYIFCKTIKPNPYQYIYNLSIKYSLKLSEFNFMKYTKQIDFCLLVSSKNLTVYCFKELFEQVWCSDNFTMFKAQMIRKNIELELQALILLQHQLGLVKPTEGLNDDDEIMQIVIRKSKDEYDSLLSSRQRGNQATVDMPIKKPQDLEIATKLVKSEKIVENLKSELDQQDYLNKKIIEEELESKPIERPKSSRKSVNEAAKGMERMNLEEPRPKSRQIRRNDDDDDVVQNNYKPSSDAANQLANSYLNVNLKFYLLQ